MSWEPWLRDVVATDGTDRVVGVDMGESSGSATGKLIGHFDEDGEFVVDDFEPDQEDDDEVRDVRSADGDQGGA